MVYGCVWAMVVSGWISPAFKTIERNLILTIDDMIPGEPGVYILTG